MRRQVFPQPPSPTTTSLRLRSGRRASMWMVCRKVEGTRDYMNVAFRRHSRRSRRFYTDDGRALLVLPPHAGLASPSATLNQAVLRARQLITLLRRELDYNAFFNTLWL